MLKLPNLLFTPSVNNFLVRMDDSTSMESLALRDGVESSGRTIMEYKRDKDGGRERLIEEVGTMVIWAFGINWMKKVADKLGKDIFKVVDMPELDISLLKAAKKPTHQSGIKGFFSLFSSPSSQSLVSHSGALKNDITPLLEKPTLKKLKSIAEKEAQKYSHYNSGKFLFATALPAVAIALGLPTFNQWLTKTLIAKERKTKLQQDKQNEQALASQHTIFPTHFSRSSVITNNRFKPFYTASPAYLNKTVYQPSTVAPVPLAFSKNPKQIQFSGNPLGDAAASLLQNERMNTLLIDGIISGGRIYKSRNKTERSEVMFREASIVAFLYFGQSIFQNAFTKLLGGGSDLGFDSTRFLHKQYGVKNLNHKFFNDFKAAQNHLKEILSLQNSSQLSSKEGLAFWKNLGTSRGREKIRAAQRLAFDVEKRMVNSIHQYFKEPVHAEKTNLIFETAKECGWIPTFNEKKSLLDMTQKIDTGAIFDFANSLEDAIQKSHGTASIEKIMQKAIKRRSAAWLLSNGLCTLFLSHIVPEIQHYITYEKTGKNYFPGIQPS